MTRVEKAEMWLAFALTCGEFGAGIVLWVVHGHVLTIYLAATYLLRETSGGKHHHQILLSGVKRIIKP